MKDKLLAKLMRSPKFRRLNKQEQAVELQDYSYQKRTFRERSL